MTSTRRLEYVPLSAVEVAEINPKQHDPDAIARSINRFGFVEPIVLDERTGRLIAGHGRLAMLQAAEAEGIDPPEGIEPSADGWLVPVTRGWSSRSDAEAHALGVALNQTTVAGGFDHQALAELLQDLHADDEELVQALGFAEHDLSVLLSAVRSEFQPPELEPLDGFQRNDGGMNIHLSAEEHEIVQEAVERCRKLEDDDDLTTGAALALVCQAYG